MAFEVTALRDYNKKVFDQENGTIKAYLHPGHIHYKDSQGDFQNVDLTFEDMGTYWRVTKASFRLYVNKIFDAGDLIRFDNRYEGANHSIYYRPYSIWWVNADNKSERTKWLDRKKVTGVLNAEGNKITFTNAFANGVHYEITILRSGFTKELVVDSKPNTGSAPYTNWMIGVVAGWSGDGLKIKANDYTDWDDNGYYEYTDYFTISEIATGLKSYIKHAYGIDSSTPRPRRVALPVFFEKQGGTLWQGKLISENMIENAVYPIRVDTVTSYYAGAGDGDVTYSNASWDVAHDAATGTLADYTDTDYDVAIGGGWGSFWISRHFIPIDTSGLPDAATISAATLYLYFTAANKSSSDGNGWMTTVQTNQASTSTLSTADYDQCGDAIDNPTEGNDSGNRIDLGAVSTGQYTGIPLNATGIGWISKTGYTKLGLREGHDATDTSYLPDQAEDSATISSSEATGTSQDPYLEVTYTVPYNIPVVMYHYMNH